MNTYWNMNLKNCLTVSIITCVKFQLCNDDGWLVLALVYNIYNVLTIVVVSNKS